MASQSGSGDLREELRSDASTIAKTAKERLSGEIDARKGVATTQAKSLSSALETAAGELNDSPEWLRSLFQQGAQTLQRFADTVERKDARELTGEVQQLARENPGAFLGTCALAGFAAARIFKAGASSSTTGAEAIVPYGGGSTEDASSMSSGGTYSSGPYQGGISAEPLGTSPRPDLGERP